MEENMEECGRNASSSTCPAAPDPKEQRQRSLCHNSVAAGAQSTECANKAHCDVETNSTEDCDDVCSDNEDSCHSSVSEDSKASDFTKVGMIIQTIFPTIVSATFNAFYTSNLPNSNLTLSECKLLPSKHKGELSKLFDRNPDIFERTKENIGVLDYLNLINCMFEYEYDKCSALGTMKSLRNNYFHPDIYSDMEITPKIVRKACTDAALQVRNCLNEDEIPKSLLEIPSQLDKLDVFLENKNKSEVYGNLESRLEDESFHNNRKSNNCHEVLCFSLTTTPEIWYNNDLLRRLNKHNDYPQYPADVVTFFDTCYISPDVVASESNKESHITNQIEAVNYVLKIPERYVFVTGKSGVGKTTFAQCIIHHWIMKHGEVNRYKLAFFVDVSLPYSNFYDYLRKMMPDFDLGNSERELLEYLGESNILFVIDSYNKKNSKSRELLENILCNYTKSKAVIMCDQNSVVSARALSMNIPCSVVHMMGLAKDQCLELGENILKQNEKRCLHSQLIGQFTRVFKCWFPDHFYGRIPPFDIVLLAVVLCALEIPKNDFNIEDMKSMSTTKLVARLIELKKMEIIPNDIFLELGEIALGKIKTNELSTKFTAIEMIKFEDKINFESNIDLSAILHSKKRITDSSDSISGQSVDEESPELTSKPPGSSERNNPNRVVSFTTDCYYFYNISEMQYFAALYIFENITSSEKNDLLENLPYNVILFLIGLLSSNNKLDSNAIDIFKIASEIEQDVVSNFNAKLDSISAFQFWFSLISETISSPSSSGNKELCSLIKFRFDKKWVINEGNFSSALGLMKCIELDKYDIILSPSIYQHCSQSLSKMIQCLEYLNRPGPNVTLQLELNTNVDYPLLDCEWLQRLNSWATLTEFSGYINNDRNITLLSQCSGLQIIALRVTLVSSFNEATESVNCWPSLNRMKIIIDSQRFQFNKVKLNKLPDINFELELNVSNLTSKSVPTITDLLRQWLPR